MLIASNDLEFDNDEGTGESISNGEINGFDFLGGKGTRILGICKVSNEEIKCRKLPMSINMFTHANQLWCIPTLWIYKRRHVTVENIRIWICLVPML